MATIQIVLEPELLAAADREAKRRKVSRSWLIGEAVREHLRRVRLRDLEEQDRRGYEAIAQRKGEYLPWTGVAAWPQE